MNIRERFLKSKLYDFKKVDSKWSNFPLFKFEEFKQDHEKNNYLKGNQIHLGFTDKSLVFLDDLKLSESDINPDFVVFASRHRSQTSRPSFLTHTTGNWGKNADFGGNPFEVSYASALLLKAGLLSLIEQFEQIQNSDLVNYSLDIEVTHHGPTTLEKPLIFMELGSSEEEWKIVEAGEFIASAILKSIINYLELKKEGNQKIGIGFGGTHYSPQFKKLLKDKDIAVSHICPKYFIQDLNKEIIEQTLKKTLEEVDYFIIDWKGTNSQDKKHLLPLLEEFNIPIKKTKEL